MESQPYTPPKANASDKALAATRVVLSAVPYVGGPGVELISALVTPSLERRRQAWMEDVAEGLRRLEANSMVRFEELQSNEDFVSTVMHATQAAMHNHQEEKLKALRNAVLNAAMPNPIEQSLQEVFLGLIDTFTVWHLRILWFAQRPTATISKTELQKSFSHASLSDLLERVFPELRGGAFFYQQVWAELHSRGLVKAQNPRARTQPANLIGSQLTEFGQWFLQFITEPDQAKDNETAPVTGSTG